jgi:hypothetical protein
MGATQASVETISKPRTDSRYSCVLIYAHIDQATAEKVRTLIDQSGLPSWIDLDGLNPALNGSRLCGGLWTARAARTTANRSGMIGQSFTAAKAAP